MEALFQGHAVPPAVRARLAILRDRASSAEGLEVTCGGSSMEPLIRRGARVRVLARDAQIGRVAAFVAEDGQLELHRLVARAPFGWWAHLGDNQVDVTPGLVHASHIVGIVDVPARPPRARERLRALRRLGRATVTVVRRSLQPR